MRIAEDSYLSYILVAFALIGWLLAGLVVEKLT